jgi:3-oxoacyl-[acyl-carrier protein] reductase
MVLMRDLISKNKIALITGGSRGIGRECVLAFARGGYDISFTYYSNEERAEVTKQEAEKLGIDIATFKMNISDISQIDDMVAQTLERFGRIDVLVNNAGISEIKTIEDIDEANWDNIVDTN